MEQQQQQQQQSKKLSFIDPFPLDYLHKQYPPNTTQQNKDRIKTIIGTLSQSTIDLKTLRNQCFYGIPDDCKGLRSICWKILCGYLPPDKSQWKKILKESNETYKYYCDEFFINRVNSPPQEKLHDLKREWDKAQVQMKKKVKDENFNADELECYKYKQFFLDSGLFEEVEKDTTRTRSEMHFFVTDTSDQYAILNYKKQQQEEILKKQKQEQKNSGTEDLLGLENDENQEENKKNEEVKNDKEQDEIIDMDNQKYKIQFKTYIQDERIAKNERSEKHYDVLSRILYVYAKANIGIRYVQGMNEILAPLYFTFQKDQTNQLFIDNNECDSFFCFTKIMGDGIKDSFVQTLDESDTGIKTKVNQLNKMLEQQDNELWQHLTNMGINPHFYALRWIMLALTQEFELHDVLRLWDSFLSIEDRMSFLYYLCLAILNLMRPNLLTNDFSKIMETLQNVDFDIEEIIELGNKMYKNQQYIDQKNTKYQENLNGIKNNVKTIGKGIGGFFKSVANQVQDLAKKQ